MADPDVGSFFDSLSDDYTATIERCFPRYREMLWALLNYLPPGNPAPSILELGSGTGNLTVLLAERFPHSTIDIVDLSAESLSVCKSRLPAVERFRFHCADMRSLPADGHQYDLVISSIAIHHLNSLEKQTLFHNLRKILKPDGRLVYADQFRGATPDLYRQHIDEWHALSTAAGSNEAEWAMWMEHQRDHDFHDSLLDQIDWLRAAGFKDIDCVWRFLLWCVVHATATDLEKERI